MNRFLGLAAGPARERHQRHLFWPLARGGIESGCHDRESLSVLGEERRGLAGLGGLFRESGLNLVERSLEQILPQLALHAPERGKPRGQRLLRRRAELSASDLPERERQSVAQDLAEKAM